MDFCLKIEKLFGNWNYDLKFNQPIHYLVGVNGSGKTTIMKILSALSRGDSECFFKFPFERIAFKEKNQLIELNGSDFISFRRPSFQIRFIDEFGMPDWMETQSIDEVIEDISFKIKRSDKNDLRMETLFNLLKKFIDKRSSFSNGLGFRSVVGDEIKVNHLSDGEKRLLVFWYCALFEMKEHSWLMIDTPETSLHITLQRELNDDLMKIHELNHVNFILATHSPSIIDDWDMVVDLSEAFQKQGSKA